jgi:hypothetical protein
LDTVITQVKQLRQGSGGAADEFVFVKTSCRSPKDTVLHNAALKQGVIDALEAHTRAHGRTPAEASENGTSCF